jgi:hypothetical protein
VPLGGTNLQPAAVRTLKTNAYARRSLWPLNEARRIAACPQHDMRSEFSMMLDGHTVHIGQQAWRIRPVNSAIEEHGFHEMTVLLDGVPSYVVMLCISESVHRRNGGEVDWLIEALTEWLERLDKFDGDVIELVS